jgi:hypothetical protein
MAQIRGVSSCENERARTLRHFRNTMSCLPVVTSSFLRWKAARTSVAPVYAFAKNATAAVI